VPEAVELDHLLGERDAVVGGARPQHGQDGAELLARQRLGRAHTGELGEQDGGVVRDREAGHDVVDVSWVRLMKAASALVAAATGASTGVGVMRRSCSAALMAVPLVRG